MNKVEFIKNLGNKIINQLNSNEFNIDEVENELFELETTIGKISNYDSLDKRTIRKILVEINNAIGQEELETA